MQLDTSPAVLPEGVRPCRTRIGSTTGSNVMARQKRGIVGWYYGTDYRRIHNAWVKNSLTRAEIRAIFFPPPVALEAKVPLFVSAEAGINTTEHSGEGFGGPSD